jgi:hypothetical protein
MRPQGARLLIRLYPPSFRERYGDELLALAEDSGLSARCGLNIAMGAARAWVRPSFVGSGAVRLERRRIATLSTVWVAWCLGAVSIPAVNRELDDPRLPTMTITANRLLNDASIAFAVGAVIAVLGGALVGWRALRRTARASRWAVLRPMLPVAALLTADGIGAGLIGWWRSTYPWNSPHFSAAFTAAVLAWLAGLGLLVLAAALGPVVALRRSGLGADQLRQPVLLSWLLAAVLAVAALLDVAAVVTGGGSDPLAWLGCLGGVGFAATAAASAARAPA